MYPLNVSKLEAFQLRLNCETDRDQLLLDARELFDLGHGQNIVSVLVARARELNRQAVRYRQIERGRHG